MPASDPEAEQRIRQRALDIYHARLDETHRRTDRVFLWLLLAQWAFAIVLAVWMSPYAWDGRTRSIHLHVQIAVFFGALINALPIALILLRPGWAGTRYTIGVVQMLWSALLIHLTGGRIETHFHVFVSLAFLAFYKDWRVLVPATLTVVADHFLRGMYWPESVYGTLTLQWWRVFEHASWVVFEDIVLIFSCLRAVTQDRAIAERDAGLEAAHAGVERQVVERTQELSRAHLAAEAASRAKSEFISTVSHELRTPLTAIRGSLALIAGGAVGSLPEKPQHLIQLAYRNTDRLALLINDILDFEKMDSGNLPLELAVHSLPELLEQAAETNQGYAQNHNVRFVLLKPLPQVRVTGDINRISQVMANLLSNAAKFSPPHSSIEIGIIATDGKARVFVKDCGPGITQEFSARIFQRFSQADSSDSRAKGGTGLGLAISKGLIEQMGGTIGYESVPGNGATFFFELPLADERNNSGLCPQ